MGCCCGIFSSCFRRNQDSGNPQNNSSGYSDSAAKAHFLLMMFVGIVVSLSLKVWGQKPLLDLYIYHFAVCKSETCAGNQAVFRFSFALAIFFLIMLLAVLTVGSSAHRKYWTTKWLLFTCLTITSFFIPNSAFLVYADISRFFAAVFLLLQVLVLIDFAYAWNTAWVAHNRTKYYAGILFASAFMISLSLTGTALFYLWFAQGPHCALQRFFISFNIVLAFAYTLVSISSFSEHGALLPSSVVVAYNTFLIYSALKSDPSECNSFYSPEKTDALSLLLGIAFAGLSISYSSWSLSRRQDSILGMADDDRQLLEEHEKESVSSAASGGDDDEEKASKQGNAFFHLIMVTASMYMGMLLTNWAVSDLSGNEQVGLGWQNVWVNVGTSWATSLLYLWTLAAPAMFPDRDFGH